MRKTRLIGQTALASALAAVVLVSQGAARSTEAVSCTSAGRAVPNLTGNWTSSRGLTYSLLQKGSCLWWTGPSGSGQVFFGSAFSFTVTGVWADPGFRRSGTLTLLVDRSGKSLTLRASSGGGSLPSSWTKRS